LIRAGTSASCLTRPLPPLHLVIVVIVRLIEFVEAKSLAEDCMGFRHFRAQLIARLTLKVALRSAVKQKWHSSIPTHPLFDRFRSLSCDRFTIGCEPTRTCLALLRQRSKSAPALMGYPPAPFSLRL
jgi:hypothetical protein